MYKRQGDLEGLTIKVSKAEGEKCERCWMFSDTVGKNADHPVSYTHLDLYKRQAQDNLHL